MITGSTGSPTVASMAVPVANLSVYIVMRVFIFRLDCELMLAETWSGRSSLEAVGG